MDKPWHTAAPNFSIQGILRGPDKSKAASNNAVWNNSDRFIERQVSGKKEKDTFILDTGTRGRWQTQNLTTDLSTDNMDT